MEHPVHPVQHAPQRSEQHIQAALLALPLAWHPSHPDRSAVDQEGLPALLDALPECYVPTGSRAGGAEMGRGDVSYPLWPAVLYAPRLVGMQLPEPQPHVPLSPIVHPAPVTGSPASALTKARARVLVVDDDLDVARITSAFLRKSGFEVLMVSCGDDAIAALQGGSTYDVMVTDYAMNGLNGVDLALQARDMTPRMGIVIVTGYAGAEGLGGLPADIAVLYKPFNRLHLLLQVELLASRAPSLPLLAAAAAGSAT